ncbi:MAG: Hsp20/alpha crystallin family protein [Planctomycetota bacterium]|nr:Hsp20/alpha crystallin family protein [Planctomycetota bacterium]
MPFNGVNSFYANTPANFSATTLPYARQNAFMGQLPGMWQGEFMSPVSASVAGYTPWVNSFYGQQPMNTMNGFNSSILGTVAGQNMSPMMNTLGYNGLGVNALGFNGLGINTLAGNTQAQQATINGQTTVAHLPVDVLDDGTQYLLVADLPGVKIDDLELTVENGLLVIKAVAQSTTFIPGIDVTAPVATIAREKAPVKVYQRAFAIGRDITVENITASITNGVLTISLPKVNMVTGTPSRIRNTVAACA